MLACTLRGLSVFGGSTYACKSCLLTWQSVDRRGWVSSRPDSVRISLKATSKWVEMMQHHELHTDRLDGERHMTRATPISGPLPQCTAVDMSDGRIHLRARHVIQLHANPSFVTMSADETSKHWLLQFSHFGPTNNCVWDYFRKEYMLIFTHTHTHIFYASDSLWHRKAFCSPDFF